MQSVNATPNRIAQRSAALLPPLPPTRGRGPTRSEIGDANIEHPTLNIEHRSGREEYPAADVNPWGIGFEIRVLLPVGLHPRLNYPSFTTSMFSVRCWMFDVRICFSAVQSSPRPLRRRRSRSRCHRHVFIRRD